MSKKTLFGILLLAIFIISCISTIMPGNTQFNRNVSQYSNNIINSSVDVTHTSDLQLYVNDTVNHTISWTLTENKNYLGQYSFTNDAIGSVPSNWTKDTDYPSGCSVQTYPSLAGHRGVLELNDTSTVGYAGLYTPMAATLVGDAEFWLYSNDRYCQNSIGLYVGAGYTTQLILFALERDYFSYAGAMEHYLIMGMSNVWYHIHIHWNTTAWSVEIQNDTLNIKYDNLDFFLGNTIGAGVTSFRANTRYESPDANYKFYIDAVDFSWAPGYYSHRNMAYSSPSLLYAIFKNQTRQTNWQSWTDQVSVRYNVTGQTLGLGLHNISLVYNDGESTWWHDDVTVRVDNEPPKFILNSSVAVTHPSDFGLYVNDIANHTISWTLTDNEPKDYLGQYSFTNDAIGSVPSNWTKDTDYPSGCSVQTYPSLAGHRGVLELNDTSTVGYAGLYTPMAATLVGDAEFWLYTNDRYCQSSISLYVGAGYTTQLILFALTRDYFYYAGATGQNLIMGMSNVWYHIHIHWNTTAWSVEIQNDTLNIKYDNLDFFLGNTIGAGVTSFRANTRYQSPDANYKFYIDAVDFSWAPGYYSHRNMAYSSPSLSYAIFENQTRQSNWQSWTNQVSVRYNVTGQTLGLGLHNISLVYNDGESHWWHDDVTVRVDNESTNFSSVDVTHPSDFDLYASDTANHTISWTLSENYSLDYFGYYNFTNDLDGSNPVGWTVSDQINAPLQVISEYSNHRKVVKFRDDLIFDSASCCYMDQTFTAISTGTVELWIYGEEGVLNRNIFGIELWSGSSTDAIHTIIDWTSGVDRYVNYRGSPLLDQSIVASPNFSDHQWIHIRIVFNCSSDTFVCYVNGVNQGTFNFRNAVLSISKLRLGTGQFETGGNFCAYIDAVDYSWASGYYLNRNMDHSPVQNITVNAVYSVFQNGIQKMPWQQWNKQVQIDYNVSGLGLSIGSYNISLAFNDSKNSWSHDDVIVTVMEDQKPNIDQVNQDIKTVTAHVLDNTQIQNVYIETNSTGNPTGNYLGSSFLNDPNGAIPEGWDLIYSNGATHMYVIEEKLGHHKVLEGYDNSATSTSDILNCWPVRASGSIEFWFCSTLGTGTAQVVIINIFGEGSAAPCAGPYLIMDLDAGRIDYSNGTIYTICSVDLTQWTHLLIDFNCNSDTFNITVNGVLRGINLGFLNNLITSTSLQISSVWSSTGGFYFYLDSIDYSWAPGYFLNRNMVQNSFNNYSMTLESGTLQDGIWNYTFIPPPSNTTISFRIYAQDIWGNINCSEQYHILYSDIICPQIENLVQTPIEPIYQEPVNITVQIIDNTKIQTVLIESNHIGLANYSMTLLSGSLNDGVWGYTFNNYLPNKTISYRILAQDTFGNWNITDYYSFGYFDTLGPNILSLVQEPSAPTYLDIVNVTVHITDNTQIQAVSIQTNYTGTFSNYPMSLISGNLQDGIWKFTFNSYPLNAVIMYSISTIDIFGNFNSSAQSSFGVFDLVDPAMVTLVQTPVALTKWEAVKVTVHVQENFALGSVLFNSNYTGSWVNYPMTLLNGTLQDGFWEYTVINYSYNESIWYNISAIDVAGRSTTTGYLQFGIFPIVSHYVPLDLAFEVDIGMAGDRRTDITFTFQNTGNTNLVNINFTIQLPTGWTTKTPVQSVSQLAPGQIATVTFKITVPKDIGEFLELVVIEMDATIPELGLDWPTQSIEVVVSGKKVWDLFIWLVVIVGSASAAVTTTYIFIHKRAIVNKDSKGKFKGKTLTSLKAAISADFPGPYAILSIELMERINALAGLTDEEKQLLIEDVAQLDEEQANKWIDVFETTLK